MTTYVRLGESCDAVLPSAALVDTYPISVILPIQGQLGDLHDRLVIDNDKLRNVNVFDLANDPGQRSHEHAGFQVEQFLGIEDKAPGNTLQFLRVKDADPFEVVASSSVRVNDEQLEVVLDAQAVANLLSGNEAVLVARGAANSLLAVEPQLAESQVAVAPYLEVGNIAEFMAQPMLHRVDGSRFSIRLTRANVKALVETGTTEVACAESERPVLVASRRHTECLQPLPAAPVQARSATSALTAGPAPASAPLPAVIGGSSEPPPSGTGGLPPPVGGAANAPAPLGQPPVIVNDFQLAVVAVGAQRWTQLGHARGELVHSLVLAPLEEAHIEIFSWERNTDTSESNTTTEAELSFESSTHLRTTAEVVREATKGRDTANTVGGTIGFAVPSIGLSLSGNTSASESTRLASGLRISTQWVAEASSKAAARFKSTRQVKVAHTREFGTENRVTRRLRNPNTAHTLAIDVFELVAGYTVLTTFERPDIRLCVLVPICPPGARITREDLRVHGAALAAALIDRSLVEGFQAAQYLDARARFCAVACQPCTPAAAEPSAVQRARDLMAVLATARPERWLRQVLTDPKSQVHNAAPTPQQLSEVRRWAFANALAATAPALVAWLLGQGSEPVPLDAAALDALAPDKLRTAFEPEGLMRLEAMRQSLGLRTRMVAVVTGAGVQVREPESMGMVAARDGALVPEDGGLIALLRALVQGAAAKSGGSGGDDDAHALATAYPPAEVAAALEREDALLRHLNLHPGRYRMAIWRSLPRHRRMALLPWLSADVLGRIDPEPLAADDEHLAFPLRIAQASALRPYVDEVITRNAALDQRHEEVIELPTGSVTIETRLGRCDGTEVQLRSERASVVNLRAAEARKLDAETAIAQLEAKRRKLLLSASPPDLTGQQPGALDIRLQPPPPKPAP